MLLFDLGDKIAARLGHSLRAFKLQIVRYVGHPLDLDIGPRRDVQLGQTGSVPAPVAVQFQDGQFGAAEKIVPVPPGRVIRLKFYLRDARLYSFVQQGRAAD